MKNRFKFINILSSILIAVVVLFAACQEEITGPDTVPVKAEIKQVIVNNSISTVTEFNAVPEDTVPRLR